MKSVSEEEGNSGAGEPETEAGPHKKQLDRQLGVQVWERCMPSERHQAGEAVKSCTFAGNVLSSLLMIATIFDDNI